MRVYLSLVVAVVRSYVSAALLRSRLVYASIAALLVSALLAAPTYAATPVSAWGQAADASLTTSQTDVTDIFTNNIGYILGIFLAVFMLGFVTRHFVMASRGKRV